MKADIKQKWVAALRNGEYEQTRAVLRSNGGFCCLGVLCDLYAQETGMKWRPSEQSTCYTLHGISTTLPIEVRAWAELADEYGAYVEVETNEDGATHPPYRTDVSLTQLNDTWDYDFEMIADVIEQQL
jgi:hypothetical protein